MKKILVPRACVDVEEHRARGVTHIRDVHWPAGKFPDQPTVHRPTGQRSRRCAVSCARHVVQNPRDLTGRKIRVDHQPRTLLDHRLIAVRSELVADQGGAAVLPHDGVVDRLPGVPIPHDNRLALICDADGDDVTRPQVRLIKRRFGDADLRVPNFYWIVLHPTSSREDLFELLSRDSLDPAVVVKHDGP